MRGKKIAAVFLIGIFFRLNFAFAQGASQNASDISQTLVPLEVYVGDVAEVRYNFKIDSENFPEQNFEKEIKVEKIPFENLSDSLTIKGAYFSRRENDCSLVIQFVPWRTGKIDFPAFDLLPILDFDDFAGDENFSCKISLLPVEIKSIVEKTGRMEIQPPLPPFIIPGTSYVVFALVVVAIIFLAVIFRALVKFHDLRRWISQMRIRRSRRRNSIIALRKLKKLLHDENLSDIEFCAGLQNTARAYLSFRFDFPFESESALGMSQSFQEIFLGEIPDFVFPVLDDLTSMFIRTDYIRYAHGSLDESREPKSEHEAHLVQGERKSLVATVAKAVKIFEGDIREEKE